MHIENIQKRYRIKIFPGKNSPGSGFGVFNGLAMAAGGTKKLRVREMNKGKDKRKKITLKLPKKCNIQEKKACAEREYVGSQKF